MDPNKSASAPPAGWNAGEKSEAGMAAPPPYQDHPQYPHAGYPQPGPGYPHQGFEPGPQGGGPPPQYQYGQQPLAPGQQYPMQPGSIMVQPTVYVTRPPLAQPVNDYMGYSIFTMLCCCLPLGVAALIYSISTRDANMAGDQITAARNSNTARKLNHVSMGIGLTGMILTVVYVFVISSSL